MVLVTPTVNSQYSVIGMDAKGCMNTATADVTVNVCTAVLDPLLNVNLNPNPTSGQFEISSLYKIEKIMITDALGNSILESEVNSTELKLDISQFENGIYFVRTVSGQNTTVSKIVKQ